MIELPWPPKELGGNSRSDRRHTTAKRKAYKLQCWAIARQEMPQTSAHIEITFHPPDARRRDIDNMLRGIKYGLDGVALALGVDDAEWDTVTLRRGEPCRPNGKVCVAWLNA